MAFSCGSLSESITGILQQPYVQYRLRESDGDRANGAIATIREELDGESRALFDAEFNGLPAHLVSAIGDLIVRAADAGVPFSFASTIPDKPIEIGRARRITFDFSMEESGISVTMCHSLRHPSWLPEVAMPVTEAAAV